MAKRKQKPKEAPAEPTVPEQVPEPVPEVAEQASEVVEERRAPDQDGAIEVAFVEGVLPEVDRRAEPEPQPTEGLHVTHPDQFQALSGTPNRAPEPELPNTDNLHGFSNPDAGRKPIVTD